MPVYLIWLRDRIVIYMKMQNIEGKTYKQKTMLSSERQNTYRATTTRIIL